LVSLHPRQGFRMGFRWLHSQSLWRFVQAKKYFINVPSWGSAIFKLVRPLLSENTVKKFVICSRYCITSETACSFFSFLD
jgi:hypothetical protein